MYTVVLAIFCGYYDVILEFIKSYIIAFLFEGQYLKFVLKGILFIFEAQYFKFYLEGVKFVFEKVKIFKGNSFVFLKVNIRNSI